MKPIKFKEVNTVYGANQSEYKPLPAYKLDTPQGEVVVCFKLSVRERLKMLLTGRMWLISYTFNKPLLPLLPLADSPIVKPKK